MESRLKKILAMILRLVLSFALIAFLFTKIDMSIAWDAVKQSNIGLLIFSFFLFVFLMFLTLCRWDILLQGLRLKFNFSKLLVSFSGGTFFNLFLPTTIGGDVIKGLHLAAYSRRTREVVASVIIDRLSGYIALNVVVLVSFAVGFSYLSDRVVLLAIAILSLGLLVVLILLFHKRAYRFASRLLGKNRFTKKLKNVQREIFYLQSRPRVLFRILGVSLIVQFGIGIMYYLIACSLGIEKPVIYFFILVPILIAISTLPLTIGGLGLRDWAAVFLFTKIGISKELAIVISLLSFLFLVIVGIIGGIVYVFSLHPRWLQHHKTHPTARYQKTKR